jgi:hypothetical protein
VFGPSEINTFSLDESRTDDIPQVSAVENEQLVKPFSEEKVRHAVFQMEHNKAPSPDGFPVKFYQACWSFIKDDLLALFTDFHDRSLSLYRLNFGTIILIPKCREATTIQQYRPICLLNVSFNFFTKVATNRITNVAKKVISPT